MKYNISDKVPTLLTEDISTLDLIKPPHYDETELTLIDALDIIREASCRSQLSDKLWTDYEQVFEYMRNHTGLNNKQIVVLACLCEAGDGLSWRSLGQALGLSRLKTMALSPDIEEMKEKRWIVPYGINERGHLMEGFKQAPGIITAFRENRNFQPEILDGLSEQAFVDRLANYIANEGSNHHIPNNANHWWMLYLVQCNQHLPLCQTITQLEEHTSKIIMLMMVADYARYGGEINEGLRLKDIEDFFDDNFILSECLYSLKTDTNELFEKGLIEHACNDGVAEPDLLRLTRTARENLLSEFVRTRSPRHRVVQDQNLIKANSISPKELFYDAAVDRQIKRVADLLSPEGFTRVQNRLESLGHRKGCAILLYGAPGTGKTETALQLARATGRDIMRVDIASIRDKYVGETEKNVKAIFVKYKELCKNSPNIPILLFNEADALINSRFESPRSSVDKMCNATQNIILQEMEELEGILLATTNLTTTLDRAAERRFLYKIEFNKPSADVSASIWQSKLPQLSHQTCLHLAQSYEFSGGLIENIARKVEIDYILSGKQANVDSIEAFCQEEYINQNNRNTVGFKQKTS